MTVISINNALPSVKDFISLRQDVNWGAITPSQAEGALKHSLCGVSLMNGNIVIGMARVIGDGVLNLYIQDVIIAPSHRGQGYGAKMIEALLRHLKTLYPMNISVGLMAAKGQAPFYQSFGFSPRPCLVTDAGMQSKLGALHSRLAKTG